MDLDRRIITIRAFNTKTMRARRVFPTKRLWQILHDRRTAGNEGWSVFGITTSVKTAFNSVRREAKLEDVRFHDLRHTSATRLVRGGLSLPEVGRILGHTQPKTTYRYISGDAETAERAASILDRLNAPTPDTVHQSHSCAARLMVEGVGTAGVGEERAGGGTD